MTWTKVALGVVVAVGLIIVGADGAAKLANLGLASTPNQNPASDVRSLAATLRAALWPADSDGRLGCLLRLVADTGPDPGRFVGDAQHLAMLLRQLRADTATHQGEGDATQPPDDDPTARLEVASSAGDPTGVLPPFQSPDPTEILPAPSTNPAPPDTTRPARRHRHHRMVLLTVVLVAVALVVMAAALAHCAIDASNQRSKIVGPATTTSLPAAATTTVPATNNQLSPTSDTSGPQPNGAGSSPVDRGQSASPSANADTPASSPGGPPPADRAGRSGAVGASGPNAARPGPGGSSAPGAVLP